MKSILAMAGKDLRLLLRDRAGFFFVFFFPLIYAVFFGTVFSGEGGGMSAMGIAVVDEDRSEASRRFLKKLEEAEELSVIEAGREEALSMVRKGERVAYVILPEGFGAAKDRLFQGEGIKLEAGVDPARKAEAGMLQGILTQYAFEVLRDLFMDRQAMRGQVASSLDAVRADADLSPLTRGVLNTFLHALDIFFQELPEEEEGGGQAGAGNPMSNWQPIRIAFNSIARKDINKKKPKTSFDITMPQAFVWVFLGTAAAFGISLVTERTRGTLLRLRSAPIRLSQILAGKALACFATIVGALALLFLFFYFVFKVRPQSYSLLVLAFLSATLAFVGIMMLISVMGKTEASAGGIGWAFLLVMAMLGGGMLPLAFMPSWMQTVSNLSFVKWAVLAVEGAVWRDFTLNEMMLPCGILVAIGAAAFAAGVRLFRVTAE